MLATAQPLYHFGTSLPAFHVHNMQSVLQQPVLQLIVLLTAGSEGG